MPTQAELISWRAYTWPNLSNIWEELIAQDAAGEPTPRFGGEAINLSEAGYVFQTWITQAFRLSGIEVHPPFRVQRDPESDRTTIAELDGFLVLDGCRFIIESKFLHVDFDPIARLHLLAEQRPVGTIGLLFAAKGFTGPALDSAHILRPIRVLLFQRVDIDFIAQTRNMGNAIRQKWNRSVMYGRSNLPLE